MCHLSDICKEDIVAKSFKDVLVAKVIWELQFPWEPLIENPNI